MQINTKQFQETLKQVALGAGKIKSIPITNMLQIALVGSTLELTTRTVTSALTLKIPVVVEDDKEFTCTVWLDQFAKFVPKLPKKEVNCLIEYWDEKAIHIKTTNGEYTFPIIADDNGIVVFKKMEPKETTETCIINTADIKKIYMLHDPCVLKEFFGADMYKGYVFSNEYVFTTNEEVIAISDNPFEIDNISLTQDTVKVLNQVQESHIKCSYSRSNKQLLFETDTMKYLCYEEVDKEQYPYDTFLDYVKTGRSSVFEFEKADWSEVLGRFITALPELSDDSVYISFDVDDGTATITNYNESFKETIKSKKTYGYRTIIATVKYANILVAVNAMNAEESFLVGYGTDNTLLFTSDIGNVIVSLEE